MKDRRPPLLPPAGVVGIFDSFTGVPLRGTPRNNLEAFPERDALSIDEHVLCTLQWHYLLSVSEKYGNGVSEQSPWLPACPP
ncbi:MAG: hypothetical protein P1V20_24040 [Verrucomicrobiales bacterium]|nr:hypothetical protein [Verrucomicrobiales bacterium]